LLNRFLHTDEDFLNELKIG